MLFRKVVVGLLVCFVLPACSLFGTEDSKREELQQHRKVWQERDLSSYRFDLQVGCFCPRWLYPATIQVRADTVAVVLDPESGDTLRHPRTDKPALQEAPDSYRTIDGLFEVVERAIEEDYHRLSVQYHSRFGYPEKIDTDIGENVSDDQVTYDVSDFRASPNLHQ